MDERGRKRNTVRFVLAINRRLEGPWFDDLLDDVPGVVHAYSLELISYLLTLPDGLLFCIIGHDFWHNQSDGRDTQCKCRQAQVPGNARE